jgi:class 3 adenylate cyclase/CDGSH-type Zn-finger protein
VPAISLIPDNLSVEVAPDQTVLRAVQGAGVPIASACGGQGLCSTCRVWVVEGVENCAERSEIETQLAAKLHFPANLRLACQTKIAGPVTLRRLVLDDADLNIASLLGREAQSRVGEQKNIVVLFADIAGFTAISEKLLPYDVLFLLNKYYSAMGAVVADNRGYIDNFIGDGLMALFGVEDETDFALRGIKTGLDMLKAVDRLKPQFRATYGVEFDVRIGIHHGEAVLGSLGTGDRQRLTAIGDVVNIASRIEVANKEAGTRLLISEQLRQVVGDDVVVEDYVRLRPRGATDRMTLYSIASIAPDAEARLTRSAPKPPPAKEEPAIAARTPINVSVIAGETYYWCVCGRSSNQPFCDGSHAPTGFEPLPWTAPKTGQELLCACKRTRKPPYCDGSHRGLVAAPAPIPAPPAPIPAPAPIQNRRGG